MKIMGTFAVAVFFLFAHATKALAQPSLERLEDQLRGQAKPPAAEAPAAAETGYLGIIADDRRDAGKGIRVLDMIPAGPAEKAGLKTGDLVQAIDGRPVGTMNDFGRALLGIPAGGKLTFDVLRDGQTQRIEVTLGRRPAANERRFEQFGPIPANPPAAAQNEPPRAGLLGIRVAPVTADVQRRVGLPEARGAVVVDVVAGSPADRAGLAIGAVIVALDGQRVDTQEDLARLIAAAGPGRDLKVLHYSPDGKLFERHVQLLGATAPAATSTGPAPLLPHPVTPAVPQPVAPLLPQPVEQPAPGQDRMQVLEQRVRELEKRLTELERLLSNPPKREN